MTNQLSRRDLMRGMLAGALGLAFTPASALQLGPPPGKIALRYNENPYGPSPAALKAAAQAAERQRYADYFHGTPVRQALYNSSSVYVGLRPGALFDLQRVYLVAQFAGWRGSRTPYRG